MQLSISGKTILAPKPQMCKTRRQGRVSSESRCVHSNSRWYENTLNSARKTISSSALAEPLQSAIDPAHRQLQSLP
ncbi:TPA: hypothetical protein ACP37T_006319, partial [Pseudomonas aeruginosa]